jgi:hypothetical protein
MPEKQVPKEQNQKPDNANKVLKPNKNMRPKTNL